MITNHSGIETNQRLFYRLLEWEYTVIKLVEI